MSDDAAGHADSTPHPARPGALRRTAVVVAEVLVILAGIYIVSKIVAKLYIVALPFGVALLFTALLRPFTKTLRGQGVKPVWATWLTILVFWGVMAGIFYTAGARASSEFPKLRDETAVTIEKSRDWLRTGPLHISNKQVDDASTKAVDYLKTHRGALTTSALSGARAFAEALTGAVLAFFIGFFLMYDGEGIFAWLIGLFPRSSRPALDRAGRSAWRALSGYIRGTLFVALFHGVVMGVTLTLLGVPLALPLAVLVAFGSLIPLVGAIVFGGLAVLVTLVAKGPVIALILVGVLVAENQAEAHLLQPFVVGRYVHLHPLAIALGLASGTVFAGVWGALFAVPFTAAVWAAWVALHGGPEPPSVGGDDHGDRGESAAPAG